MPSNTITNSYFIGASSHLPTFAITTDSLNLWDYNTGIYVMGPNASTTSPYKGANFWQDWEKPASIEFFDRNKNLVVRFGADIKIYGNYSRANPQKSFEIKLHDHYGLGSFTYPMFPDKPFVTDNDNIVLRNGGTDAKKVHFRDAFMERLLKTTYTGYLATDPTVLYLNGEYWGVYLNNENHDNHWMKDNFGLNKNEIDYLKEGGSSIGIQQGSDASFWTLYNYATTQTPTTQQYYDQINASLDLKNYTDYFVAETFYNNGDWMGPWTNNIQMWRPNKAGGKWRYLVYDLDFGLGFSGSVTDNRLQIARNPTAFSYSSEMFDAVLKNPTYKRYFINRYADLMNTIFLPASANSVMHAYKDTMAFDMTAHYAKWGGSVSGWNTYINDMMTFESGRLSVQKNYIKSEFSLQGIVTLTLNVSPANAGRIEISTITPTTYPWTGDYFNGNPVTITAIPNPGFTFNHWNSTIAMTTSNPNQSVTYNFTGNDQITAYFTGSSAATKLCVSELNYNSDSAHDAGDWIELHNYGTTSLNLSGWYISDGNDNHKYKIPTGTIIPANGYLVVSEDTVKFKSQFPTVSVLGTLGFNFSNGGDQVRIFDYTNSVYLSFNYLDIAPWPLAPDGGGYTCELTSNTANPNTASSWFAGCLGGSPGRAYSGILLAPVSISGSTSFCSGQNATLNASTGSGYVYQWKNNGVNISGATSSSLVVTQSGSYSVNISSQGCANETAPTVVSVVTQQQQPQATSASRCGSGVLTLYASSNDTVFWYSANTNGTLLGFGDSLNTPILNSSTTYYARTGRTCQSVSTPVNATIVPQTAAPVTTLNVSRCGPGSVTLTATNTAPIRWYNQSSSGALLETGPTFITNTLFNDTTYYVEAGTTCPSGRVEIFVTVNTAPSVNVHDTSRCGNGSMVLTGISPYPVTWYSDLYGGSLLGSGSLWTTPPMAVTDTFYAEAINNGCASVRQQVIAIVNNIPTPPVVTDTSACISTSINLNATATEQVRWYSAPTNGTLLYTGSSFNTPTISATTIYYVENGYFCPSNRVPLTVNIGTPAAPPSSSNAARCGAGPVTLIAASPELIYWYDAPTAGNLLIISDTYVTPSISSTTTYYAEAGTVCRSLSRTPVKAIVNSIPATPSSSGTTICGPGSVTINATSNDTVYWFNTPTGGTPFTNGLSYTTSISNSTTFYIESGNICRSARIPIQAVVAQQPASPSVVNGSICGSGSVSLSANSANTVNWYNTPAGGTPLASGLSYNTSSISTTTTYYASAINGCESPLVPVVATVNPIPAVPTALGVSRCGPGTVSLSATSPEQTYWFTSASGGSPVSVGPNYSPTVSSTTTYYVEAGDNCHSARVPVQVLVNSIPSSPSVTGGSSCNQPASINLSASISGAGTVNWYSAFSGGSVLGTGLTYLTQPISTTTTYYAEAVNAAGCSSTRVPVTAAINSIPSAPSTSGASRCGAGAMSLSATGSGTISWYSSPSGGSPLATGTTYNIGTISATTTYYAETNANGCSSLRTTAIAIVNPVTAAPGVTGAANCGPASLILSATSLDPLNWYSGLSGGSSLLTGPSYTTNVISSTTTYYVEAGTTCKSPRVPVVAFINSIPSAPSLISGSNCGPGSVTLTATTSSPVVNWYSAPSGGTSLGSGLSYTTTTISSTTTYYAEATSAAGCTSARTSVEAIINNINPVPITTGASRCGTGALSLSATGLGTINWYSSISGGSVLATGNTYTINSISTTVTYYAETNNNGCLSPRTPVVATVDPQPAAPVSSGAFSCGPASLIITATSPEQINWYTVPTGGTPFNTGSNYTTPVISSTITYYLDAGIGCVSQRVPVLASINSNPSAPVITDGNICGPGNVTLTAVSSSPVNWYSSPTGGTAVGTGLNYTTPSISITTTYYAEAGSLGCLSPRVAVQAIVNSIPSAPAASGNSICGPGSLTLSATGVGQLYWFTAASGGTLLDSGAVYNANNLNVSVTYFVETRTGACKSSRSAAVATIIPLPASPSTSNVSLCGPGSATLSATSPEQIYWYTVSGSGTPVSMGSTYTTTVSATTTYYVEAGNICRSIRIPVVVSVNSNPAPPTLTNGSNCGPGSVTLTGSSASQISWYSTPSGGSPVATGPSYSTPSISSTTTYYAQSGSAGCTSTRVAVQAIINSMPTAPAATGNSKCGPGSLTLSATASGQLYWYTAATGGTLLDSGATFNTPNLNASVTYFVETRSVNCSSLRSAAVATIIPLPSSPTSSNVSICGPGLATLSASSPEQIYWYTVASGGTPVSTGPSYTPTVSTSTTYYVEAGNTCRSTRIAVQALIISPPNAPTIFDTTRCGPGTLVIQAISGNQVNWYAVPSGGSLLDTGAYFTTPFINVTTTYYAEAGIGCNSIRVPVTASVTAAPAPPNTPDVTRCGAGSVNLTASAPQQIYWYDAASGGNQVGTGVSFTTPTLTNTTTYYVETGVATCLSARVAVQAILGGTQVSTIIEGAICGSGTVVLSASSSQPVDSISWYDQPGGNLLGTGQYFVTPNISVTTPYYAVAYSSCTGLPIAINAFVFPVPTFSLGADTLYLQSGQSLTIDAGPGFSTYRWSTTETTQSISISTSGMVTVAITDANGCPATDSVYVEVVTGISSIDGKDKLVVYPNPTHGQLIVTLPESSDKYYSLKILSIDGKILMEEDVKNSFGKQQNKVISLNHFAAGVYILELRSNDYSATVKVFVQ